MVETYGRQNRPISGVTGMSMANARRQQPHRPQMISSHDENNMNRSNQAQEFAGNLYQFSGSAGTQQNQIGAISLATKQIYGVQPNVNPGVLGIDDNTIVYVSGHNIVILNVDSKQYKYIQGIEGTQGVSALAVSHNKKYLAVCEKSNQAICVVYELNTLKRRRILTASELQSTEFTQASFAYSDEKLQNYLLTLSGEPDYRVIIWLWDKQRFVAQQSFYQEALQGSIPTQATFNPFSANPDDPTCIIVTGQNIYRYYKMGDNNTLRETHRQLTKKDQSLFSTNYTCHAWVDNHLIVCTAKGEIMYCDTNGDFKMMLSDSPGPNFKIKSIAPNKQDSFMIADDTGRFQVFDTTSDPKNPFALMKLLPERVDKDEPWSNFLEKQDNQPFFPITSMVQVGDSLIYTTKRKQLMKMKTSSEKQDEFGKISYLTIPFHRSAITAICTCMKSNILVTASLDKTICIWVYSAPSSSLQLKVCQTVFDEVRAVALHPSGMYLVVAFFDKIKHYNIHPDTLVPFYEVNIRACTDIQFSHGGQLYAVADDEFKIMVFNFFTGISPEEYQFIGHHKGTIRQISWLDDDTGFVSVAADHTLMYWKLKPSPDHPNPQWTYTKTLISFTSCQAFKEEQEKGPPKVVAFGASGKDGTIREITEGKDREGRDRTKLEAGTTYSQILLTHGRKFLIAGVANPDAPGAIHIYTYNMFNKVYEMQVHAEKISKMCLNYEHNLLFSGSEDGSISFMTIADKDPRRKEPPPPVQPSHEVLIQGKIRKQIIEDIKVLKTEIDQRKDTNARILQQTTETAKRQVKKLQDEIEFEEEKSVMQLNHIQKEKEHQIKMHLNTRKSLEDDHTNRLASMKADHERKVQSDENKFQSLLEQKETQAEEYQDMILQIEQQHEALLNTLEADNRAEKDQCSQEIIQLEAEMKMLKDSAMNERKTKEDEAWTQIDELTDKNKAQLAIYIEQGMESKAELSTQIQELTQLNNHKEQYGRDLMQTRMIYDTQMQDQQKLRQDIELKRTEISERDVTLEEKKVRILDLKKKIQELEKFKFVLDYKIKELKRDIGPREVQIQKLNEQTNKMRSEQKHFDRVNQNLMLIVDDLRMRQEGLTKATSEMERIITAQDTQTRKFKDDVYQTLFSKEQDFKRLKQGVIRLYKVWVLQETQRNVGTTDQHQEYKTQRNYLENNVKALREKLKHDSINHSKENKRILKENVTLIQEINHLKMEQHNLRCQIFKQGDDPDARISLKPPISRSRVRAQSAKLMIGRQIADVKQKVGLADQEIMQLQLELERVQRYNDEKRARIAAEQQQQTQHTMGDTGQQLGAIQQMHQPHEVQQNQVSQSQQRLDEIQDEEINNRVGDQEMDPQEELESPDQINDFHRAPDDGDQMQDDDEDEEATELK